MANPLTLDRTGRRTPSPSSTSRSPRRPDEDPGLGAAARCLQEMLNDPASLGPRRRTPGFARGVERLRAELVPILSPEALLDSYAREAIRTDVIETAYAIRWLELVSGQVRPAWRGLAVEH